MEDGLEFLKKKKKQKTKNGRGFIFEGILRVRLDTVYFTEN